MVKAEKFIVAKLFKGEIKKGDLQLQEEELPPLQDEEYLVEALYLSVDPYMRAYASRYEVGQLMIGTQVAKVIETKNSKFPLGTLIVANLGWRSYTIIGPNDTDYNLYVLPDLGTLSPSLALGVLGMPGNTAYFGFLDICKPKEGETVVVSGAAGAVGSHVGQIAKIKGCKVIGIAGSDEKARWLKTIGFDHVINYKTTPSLKDELLEAAPNGVDCYFDNVGGEISSTVIYQMNEYGRISVCGSISSYNSQQPPKVTIIQPPMVFKRLFMQGFVVLQYQDRWMEGIQQNLQWVQEGLVKFRETITDEFANAPQALIGVMKGENTGKAVVRVKATNVESHSVDFKSVLHSFKKLDNK